MNGLAGGDISVQEFESEDGEYLLRVPTPDEQVGGGTAAVGDAKTGQNSRRNSDRTRAASSSLDRTRDPPQSALESVLGLV